MKIKVNNNWEVLEYKFNGKRLDSSKGGQVVLSNGLVIDYKSKERSGTYSDHGHSYEYSTYVLIGLVPFNGQILEVDLAELDISKILPHKRVVKKGNIVVGKVLEFDSSTNTARIQIDEDKFEQIKSLL